MDQRVLAFVKVGLWLADCSPVESHPLLHRVVDAECSSRCVVVMQRCCARVALSCWLSLAAMQCSSRCFVASLSSACPCRSVLCSMSLLFVSRLLLLRCCLALMLLCCVRRRFSVECSSRFFVSADSHFTPCCARACRWCPALSLGRLWLGCGCGCRGHAVVGVLAPGVLPSPVGCLASRGWGCFLAGIKITPRPSSWKVEGVGVHFMLTNSIHPGVTVALPAAPTTSALGRVGRGSASRAGLRA